MGIVLTNAGNGPIIGDSCLGHAIGDVAAFIDELDMNDPPVAVTMQFPKHYGTGRYSTAGSARSTSGDPAPTAAPVAGAHRGARGRRGRDG